jgi:hypothetical protein
MKSLALPSEGSGTSASQAPGWFLGGAGRLVLQGLSGGTRLRPEKIVTLILGRNRLGPAGLMCWRSASQPLARPSDPAAPSPAAGSLRFGHAICNEPGRVAGDAPQAARCTNLPEPNCTGPHRRGPRACHGQGHQVRPQAQALRLPTSGGHRAPCRWRDLGLSRSPTASPGPSLLLQPVQVVPDLPRSMLGRLMQAQASQRGRCHGRQRS